MPWKPLVSFFWFSALLVSAPASAAAQPAMSWALKPGAKFHYRTTVETTRTRGDGSPRLSRHVIDTVWTVEKTKDGEATVAIDIERIRYRDRRYRYDSKDGKKPKKGIFAKRMFNKIDALIKRKTTVTVDRTGRVGFAKAEDQPRFYMQRDAMRLGLTMPPEPSAAANGWSRTTPVLGELSITDTYRYRVDPEALRSPAARIAVEYEVEREDEDAPEPKKDPEKGAGSGDGKGGEKMFEGRGVAQFDRGAGCLRWLREETLETTTTTRGGRARDDTRRTVTTIALVEDSTVEGHAIDLESFEGACMCAFDGKSLGRMPRALKKLGEAIKWKLRPGAPLVVSPAHQVSLRHLRKVFDLCVSNGLFARVTMRPLVIED